MASNQPSPVCQRTPKVFVASNVGLVSEALHLRLDRRSEIELVGNGRLSAATAARITETKTDVLVLDVGSSGAGAFAADLRQNQCTVGIVGIAIGSTTLDIADWAELGVAGFVDDHASIEDVVAAIKRVSRGEFSGSPKTTAALVSALVGRVTSCRMPEGVKKLTPRETQILLDLGRGATNKEIARRLGISAATVKNHVHHVLEKLDVRRRHDAGAIARSGRF
ncbi:MAG: response regulator transcription factor [Rhodobacter sp.]|nr:response regulator transcription factor [Rhodobacter sp.]